MDSLTLSLSEPLGPVKPDSTWFWSQQQVQQLTVRKVQHRRAEPTVGWELVKQTQVVETGVLWF